MDSVPSWANTWLKIGLWTRPAIVVVIGVLTIVMQDALGSGEVSGAMLGYSLLSSALNWIGLAAFYGGLIAWHFNAMKDFQGSGLQAPGWAFGWLIPLAHAILPFVAWKGAFDQAGKPLPSGFKLAWGAFIVFVLLSFVGFVMGSVVGIQAGVASVSGGEIPETPPWLVWMGFVNAAVLVVFAIGFLRFSRGVEAATE